MLICADCINIRLQCPVSNYPIRPGMCELCGNNAYCYCITIPGDKTKKGSEIPSIADSIREAIRLMYYPDIDTNDGSQLADYTVERLYGRSTEEFVKYRLNKEIKENEKKTMV
ncbi:MAG: hypothetical protein EFT35_09800 [Methanophagales archaeon ANME-1-THS]|nr:MAG: hypothetical protein EFT35_09800 [Methanophagales archaeon ANME-1-THS]